MSAVSASTSVLQGMDISGLPAAVASVGQHFEYSPLENDTNSIRILEALPELRDGHIQVRMRNDSSPGEYRCLSYMWGTGPDEHPVFVNDKRIFVRQNLLDFLQTARRRFSNQPLWIDALCINQRDNIEKGHQVQRMGQIYKIATQVLVWLGDLPELDFVFEKPPEWPELNLNYYELEKQADIYYQKLDKITDGLRELLANPYWERAWIAQEIILANDVQILTGNCQASWASLHERMSAAVENNITQNPSLELWQIRSNSIDRFTIFFYRFIWTSRCFDPRDRIYSVLAFLDDTTFEVDYSEDLPSFFWRAGEHFGAWDNCTTLKVFYDNLRLDVSLLAENVQSSGPKTVTLRANRSNIDTLAGEYRCGSCGKTTEVLPTVVPSDVVFCVPEYSAHVVLHFVQDRLHSVTYHGPPWTGTFSLEHDAFQYWINDDLVPLEKISTGKRYSDGIHRVQYRVNVPSLIVLEELKRVLEARRKS